MMKTLILNFTRTKFLPLIQSTLREEFFARRKLNSTNFKLKWQYTKISSAEYLKCARLRKINSTKINIFLTSKKENIFFKTTGLLDLQVYHRNKKHRDNTPSFITIKFISIMSVRFE